ncbi:MAG TPA: hypothetical protein DET40_01075 [Lentisphaeria bacterium]|nr:MAG: hypothetical protein A2X45_25070 [Lentisphaerae bacterium GWF2_50_93]HCE42124.1 hypothetical protein [Lentisphaeria bacterium]
MIRMNNRFLLASTFAFVFAVDWTILAGQWENKVINGAITDGDAVPKYWTEKWEGNGGVRDTTVFKSAPASLRVEGKCDAFQMFDCKGGEKFTLKGWLKSAAGGGVQVVVQSFNADWSKNEWKQLVYVSGDTDWQEFSKDVEIPSWAGRFRIALKTDGNAKGWLDDVRVGDGEVAGTPASNSEKDPIPAGKPWEPKWGQWPGAVGAWMNTHNGKVAEAKKNSDAKAVFFGDSITQGWGGQKGWEKLNSGWKALNFGIGGDGTSQVLYRIKNGELEPLSPKAVVICIGTNNLYGDTNAGTDEEIAKGIAEIIKTVQTMKPETKILLIGILPRQNDYFTKRILKINEMVKKLADGNKVAYVEFTDKFQESLGKMKAELYSKDQLHLASPGYDLWADLLRPELERLMK